MQAANLAGFRASEDPRFEAGIPDFMNGILNFSIHFNVVPRKVDWRNPKMKSLNSMPVMYGYHHHATASNNPAYKTEFDSQTIDFISIGPYAYGYAIVCDRGESGRVLHGTMHPAYRTNWSGVQLWDGPEVSACRVDILGRGGGAKKT